MDLPARIRPLAPTAFLVCLFTWGCVSREATPTDAWQIVELPTKADLWGVQFLDAQKGYLVGGGVFVEGGLIGRTVDGGLSWEFDSGLVSKQRGVVSFAFYDLYFLDDQRAFLAGHTGVLMGTTSGWKEFRRIRSGPVYAHLRDLDFVDEDYGWAIGESRIYGTQDGGVTWTPLGPEGQPAIKISARAFDFVDRDHGHLAGMDGKLLRTFDGGRSWEGPESKPVMEGGPDLFGIHFADVDHGWTVGQNGTIWHTDDGGRAWRTQTSGVHDFFMDVHFIDAAHGWVVGHDRELRRAVVLGTEDGGEHWRIEVELPHEELYAIDALSTGEAWAVGKHVGEGRQRLLRRVPPAAKD